MKLKSRLLVIASGASYVIMYLFALARVYDPYGLVPVAGTYLFGFSAVLLQLKVMNMEEL
jgi:hypothetical protein